MLTEKGIEYHDQFNDNMGKGNAYQRARPYHCTLLAQTRGWFEKSYLNSFLFLILNYFYRVPRIPRSRSAKISRRDY